MNLQESIRADLNKLVEAGGSTPCPELIELLNKKFPGCNAVSTKEWDGNEGGVWFRGSESCDITTEYDGETYKMPLYNDEVFQDTFGTNPEVEEFLDQHNWYSEPYDSGTLMAYPG